MADEPKKNDSTASLMTRVKHETSATTMNNCRIKIITSNFLVLSGPLRVAIQNLFSLSKRSHRERSRGNQNVASLR